MIPEIEANISTDLTLRALESRDVVPKLWGSASAEGQMQRTTTIFFNNTIVHPSLRRHCGLILRAHDRANNWPYDRTPFPIDKWCNLAV
jgi:hypothetical protein